MELGGERARPAAVAPWMDLQRDPPATLVHLQGAGPAGNVKVPVTASLAASQLALASDNEAASFALLENLLGVEVDAQFQHATTVVRRPARLARNLPKQASRRLTWPFGERLRMYPPRPLTVSETVFVSGLPPRRSWLRRKWLGRKCVSSAHGGQMSQDIVDTTNLGGGACPASLATLSMPSS